MFSANSRYASLLILQHQPADRDRAPIAYVARRFLPQAQTLPLLTETVVGQRDRLDLIAYRTLGQAELSWSVCDANDAMDPFALTADAGTVLRIPAQT
jgi:hypothetical protein